MLVRCSTAERKALAIHPDRIHRAAGLAARRALRVKVMLEPVLKVNPSINEHTELLFVFCSLQLLVLWGRLGNRDVASVLEEFTVRWEEV